MEFVTSIQKEMERANVDVIEDLRKKMTFLYPKISSQTVRTYVDTVF